MLKTSSYSLLKERVFTNEVLYKLNVCKKLNLLRIFELYVNVEQIQSKSVGLSLSQAFIIGTFASITFFLDRLNTLFSR